MLLNLLYFGAVFEATKGAEREATLKLLIANHRTKKCKHASKAIRVGMVSKESPSPIKRAAAGFCIGFLDNTDEAGEVAHPPAKRTTKNMCQKQFISLAKHAWEGEVWGMLKKEIASELLEGQS